MNDDFGRAFIEMRISETIRPIMAELVAARAVVEMARGARQATWSGTLLQHGGIAKAIAAYDAVVEGNRT